MKKRILKQTALPATTRGKASDLLDVNQIKIKAFVNHYH
jgi:hypothetical protein